MMVLVAKMNMPRHKVVVVVLVEGHSYNSFSYYNLKVPIWESV